MGEEQHIAIEEEAISVQIDDVDIAKLMMHMKYLLALWIDIPY